MSPQHSPSRLRSLCLAITLGLPLVCPALELDFASSTQVDEALVQGMGSGTQMPAWTESDGLGKGGALRPPTGAGKDSFLLTTREALPANPLQATVSVCFQVRPSTGAAALPLTIGFSGQSPAVMSKTVGIPDAPSLTVSLRNLGTDRDASGLTFQTVCYNDVTSLDRLSPQFKLEPGQWYGLSATYKKKGEGGKLTALVYPVDAQGYPTGANVSEINWSIDQSAIGSEDFYGVLSSQYGDRRGLEILDHYKTTAE